MVVLGRVFNLKHNLWETPTYNNIVHGRCHAVHVNVIYIHITIILQ